MSDSDSSSDDGIFTELVDLNKKPATRRTPTSTASPARSARGTAAKARQTTQQHRQQQQQQTQSQSHHHSPARPNDSAGPSSSSLAAGTGGDGGSPVISTEGNNSSSSNTTAELSVMALQAMSSAAAAAPPATPRSASVNTECSSSPNEQTGEGKHKKERRRRRLVGGTRPPLHRSTLTAAVASAAAADVELEDSGAGVLSRAHTTVSSAASAGGAAVEDADFRGTPERVRRYSSSTGDLITGSSLASAANDATTTNTATSRRASSPHTKPVSGRARRYLPRGAGSPPMPDGSPPSSSLAAPVAAHMLSDEAYLDTFKIPALIAQLSLSLMAAKPMDLRAFTRDWLADRLVSEEDEDDDAGGVGGTLEEGTLNRTPSAIAVPTAAGAGGAGRPSSYERGSNPSCNMAGSSSMSDAMSNHSSSKNVDAASAAAMMASAAAASTSQRTSNSTSLRSSTRGARGGGPMPSRGSSLAEVGGQGELDGDTNTNDDDDTAGIEDDSRRSQDDRQRTTTTISTSIDLEDSPPELLITTSEKPTLLDTAAAVASASDPRRAAERKNLVRRTSASATAERGGDKRVRKSRSGSGSGGARNTAAVRRTPQKRRAAAQRGARALRTSTTESHSTNSSPAHTPSKATKEPSVVHGHGDFSSPNTSILNTLSPQEASTMNEEERKERAKMLADMAEAAFLHEVEEKKRKGARRGEQQSKKLAAAADDGDGDGSAASSSSSSSSASFFDSPATEVGGWSRVALTPSSSLSHKDGAGAENSEKAQAQNAYSLPLPVPEDEAVDTGDGNMPNVSSLTEVGRSGADEHESHAGRSKLDETVSAMEVFSSPLYRQQTWNPSSSSTTVASSSAVAAAAAIGAVARASATSATSIPSTLSPDREGVKSSGQRRANEGDGPTPPSSKFQSPQSTTAEHSRTASSDVEHLAAAPPTTGANTAAAVAHNADGQENQKSSSSSSSSDDAGDDNTSFAMFAPLLAVDKHTNEVIDYRTSVGSASGQPTYPGAPPLNIPSGGITRMATPPLPGAPPSHLVNSLSGGANGTQSAASGPGTSASLSGVSGSSAALAQTHTSTAVSQPPQFPPYAPRPTTGAFNFLPTPMLADMVGGGGLTNSSFGRRAVQNSSFGRRSGAATAALAALARQGEYAVTPTNASLAPPPFLTPHEPGSIGMTSNWRSAPNLQLAGFPKIGSGANTVSNLGGGGGLSVSEGALEARPRMAASSPPGPTATTPHSVKVPAEELPTEPPTAYSQVALSQGKASDGAEQRTDANNHATNADLSDAETTTSLQPDGTVHVSPLSATLKADSARRLGKLMDQLPPNKYAAAIVFLEGLMSSSANSDGVDASGSDVMSITTTAGGAASSRNLGRFTMSEQTLVEPSSLTRGGLGKPVSPVVNSNSEAIISAHAWPLPTRGESSPLGGVPIHGVSSFSERLTSSPALGSGVGDGVVGVVDVLHGADAADGMTKTAGTAAAAAAGGGGTAAMTTAAQTTGSASLEAIVRDALSQSILRTLPQTHSGTDGTASSTKHLAAQTTTTHAATTTNIMGDFAGGGGARAKEYPPVKTVNLSSVRLDPSGEWAERRQDHAMPSSVVAAALAHASASVSAAAASGPVGAEPPASSVGAFSIRSNASAPLAGAGAVQLGLAPSFYKRPSGNDLSSLCPNPSSEEITIGSPLGPNLAGTRHATVSDSHDSRTSTANHQAGAVSVREAGDSAPRRADLVAVSAAFASALTSPESQDTPVARHTSTMPPSPALLAAEPTHSDQEAPATTASDTPERMSGDAPAVPCAEESAPEQGSHDAAQDSGVEQPAVVEAVAVPLRAEAREEPYSPFVSTHNSARASFAALPSLIGVGVEGAAPTTAAAAAAAPVNPSSTGSSVTGTAASPPSHDSSDHPEGSTTLPAGAEGPHHTTQTEEKAPVTDANNTTATISTTVADENESTVKAGVSHRNSLSTPLQAPRQGTQTPSLESKTDKVHSTASTEPPLHSDGSQHPATHLDVAHGAEVGESNSSIEPPLRGSPRRQRRGHPKVDSSRANESSGSWLEGMALSGLGEISPRPTRHRSRWRSGPGFLFDGDAASTPQGTSTGTTFTSSPPPPPLPESVLAAGKEGGALSGGAAGHELLLDAVNHYEDDIDLGATLRTAVVMAAAAGSHVPHCASTSVAGSPFNTFTTQSSSLLPESISSSAFSPRGRFDAFRGDLAASSSHFDSPAPQSAAGAVIAAAATAPPLYLQQQQQQPAHAQAGTAGRPSDLSSRTISPPGTHNNSMVADGNSGSGGTSLSMMATLGAGSTAPGTTYVSPTTQLPPSLTNTPTHAGGMTTSSVAAAMNSFLSREEQVAPEEVDVVREAVARFDAFAALDETQLETLVRTMARVELSAGQTLVQEGEATLEKLLLVVSGKLSIARKGVVTRSFTRGQFYGEVEMSYHVERSRVTLTAVAPTVVYALTKMDYQKLVIHEKDARRYMFLQYVNQCELFKGLSPPTKMRLADSFRVCRLRKGAKLTEQGAPVQWMYLLMSGTVRMTCKPAPPVAFTPLTTPTTTTVPGWERQGLSRKATTAESDMAAAAAAAAAGAVAAPATPHAIVELLNAGGGGGAAANAHDAAAMASISSTAQGPNSSLRCISAGSPPFTPFHRPSALTQTPEGKPGSGVPELLQLAESKVHSVEMRKSSSSICATPLHPPGSQHGGGPQRHSSLSRDENNSSSASRRPHPHTSGSGGGAGHDGVEEVQVPTPLLGKTTPSLRSEDHGLVTTATKDKGTPELRRRRDPRRHHIDPNAQHTPVSPSTAGPRLSSAKFAVTSLNSTAASLDPSALLRCTSPSPSTASGNAKRSMSSINVVGSPRVAKAMNSGGGAAAAAAAMSSAFDGSVRLEDSVVVVDRSRGQPVGEPEFVFKCKGLFTAVATAPVQAARISRLHFEAIMTRSVIEELKRNMLLNPDYYYFESTVPEELKQEMRRMLFRLNVGSSARRRPQFALPVQRHRESHRGGSWEKSESRSGLWAGAGGGGGGGYGSGSADPEQAKHTWSRQLSTSASPMLVSQLLKKYTSVDSVALPSSPTGKSQGKRRFRTIRVQREAGATDSSNPGEEVESVRSGNGTRHGSGTGGSSGQRGRRHRTAPLEASPAPDSDGREQRACSEASAAATGTRTDATAVPDAGDNSHTTTSSARFLEAPSVSNHAARGSSSSLAEISPTTTGDDRSHLHGVGNSGGSGTGKNTGGRSRAGQRRETADNLTFSAKHSSTAGSRSRRISARGEIVFSGSRNLYRFTADAMSLNQSIVIAVVVDGTIIRWNSVAQSVTGYAPYETIGKSIYEFIASEEGRQQMRDVLALGMHYAGRWEQYTEQRLQDNRVFPFRQNTGLYQVGLALSVVPSNNVKTAEVLLLVGREGKYRAANTYASDVARWLEGLLKPQLRQFQRRMMQIESHGWRVTSEDALQVKGNLDACLSMVEQFTKFSLLNMEAVNESWRPVRLPALLSRFAVEASAFARQRGHEYYCNIEQVEPKSDIFFDAPQMLAILRLLLTDALLSPNVDEDGNPIVVHAELRVTVVEPQDTHPGPASAGGGVFGTGSPSRMAPGGAAATTSASFAATGTAAAAAAAGAKLNVIPPHAATVNVLPGVEQINIHPLPHSLSFPYLQPTEELHRHGSGHLHTNNSAVLHAASEDASLAGANSTTADTPNTSAGNTGAVGTPPSVNAAGSARLAMSGIASNAAANRAATTGCVTVANAASPTTTTLPSSLSASLRRIRFELRDDGPTIMSLRSPEAVATASMRAAGLADGASCPPTAPASPDAASLQGESAVNAVSGAGLAGDGAASPVSATPAVRGAALPQVEKILSSLGGTMYGFTRPEAAGNVVRVELPLLAVPGAGEDGRDDENGLANGGTGAPFAGGSRTFTVIVADNNRAHQQLMCQILWARQHAVVPVTSFRELVRKLEMNTADILLIDPLQIDVSSEDYEILQGDDPFDEIRNLSARLALVVMTSDFSDWRVQKLLNRHAVVELPKVGSGALVHIAMQEAEQLVAEMRDEEERIDLIRRTFTNCSAERHKVGKRIGKGAFGDVYEVEDTLTGGKMAMKRMRLHDGLLADEVVQEILAMTTLKHENIIQYFYCEKESDTLLRLYMELAPGGTLRDKIRENPGVSLSFEDIVHHLSDICHGLAYVHEQSYVHGDLKTANLLLGTRGRTKIGDFGTAKHLAPHQLLYTMVGTPQYMAPEVLTADIEERLGYNFKADIWSLGCIVLEMATGSAPFAHLECAQGMGIIKYLTELTDTPDLSPLFSANPLVYEFVKSCLDIDPRNRPTAQELLHFDILEGAVASQRAERLVKRAEMLYKLNKYAAMRADGGGGPAMAGDGTNSVDSMNGDQHDPGESGMFYSRDGSTVTEDYSDYYGDNDDEESELIDDVSASDEEDEEGEYVDEEYSSEEGSRSRSGESSPHEAAFDGSGCRDAATVAAATTKKRFSLTDAFQSQTTHAWTSAQEQLTSPGEVVRSASQLLSREQPVQSPLSSPTDDAAAVQRFNAVLQASTPSSTSTPKVTPPTTKSDGPAS